MVYDNLSVMTWAHVLFTMSIFIIMYLVYMGAD